MKVYVASSWKNQHAVELITEKLRSIGCEVLSFVENNHGELQGHKAAEDGKPMALDEWVMSELGKKSFDYDVKGATESDLVIIAVRGEPTGGLTPTAREQGKAKQYQGGSNDGEGTAEATTGT